MSNDHKATDDDFLKQFKASKQYGELCSILTPMIQSIKTSSASQKIFESCAGRIIERSALQQKRILLLRKTVKYTSQDDVQTLQNALFYLGFFEIAVTNILDQLIMIFIANNHDFYVFLKKGYAKKFEDLDKAFLNEKLDFLKHHEINLPVINKKLRNAIAHMDFDVLPAGKVLVDNQEYDLKWEILILSLFVIAFSTILKEAHFPEIIKEFSKKNLKTEKRDNDNKLIF